MKKIFNKKWLVTLMMGAAMLGACTDNALVEAPEVMQEENKDTYVATLIAGLPEEDAQTRLAYEKSDGGIKMTWAQGDQLAANALQGNVYNWYVFSLSSGAGTNQGVFSCPNLANASSYNWTIYYPGSKIRNEQDWYSQSYNGQRQKGNDNIDHLKDYHSIRLHAGYVDFNNTHIDFSGNNVDESMCMRFNLSGFEESVPTMIQLMYKNEYDAYESCFHSYNYLDDDKYLWGAPNDATISRMTLALDDFNKSTSLTAYMMMSNYPFTVNKNGAFRVYLITSKGKYYCDVPIKESVTLQGSHMYSITCKNWIKSDDNIDAFDNATNGVKVLQEAKKGNGTDIIIMGDGFDKTHFGDNGDYEAVMENAYDDFFSVEPYRALKDYFNVYYVNAVSAEDHDAVVNPSNINGATNGDANTVFNTQFESGSTSITGNDDMALEYAMQAIRTKGGKNGTPVTDENEVSRRAYSALMIVQVNVKCHAGTCSFVWYSGNDYGGGYAVAYTSLNVDDYGRKWTTIHEAGGHGFGKLADEYGGRTITSFSTGEWTKLAGNHSSGVYRNVNEYWGNEEKADGWNLSWTETTNDNVYWSSLLSNNYAYKNALEQSGKGEGLGIYRGANTYDNLYCRPTQNSVMNDQFSNNGNFFNAISRWAIWYRVMKLTGANYENFESSLNDFITFDNGLNIQKNEDGNQSISRGMLDVEERLPLAPPVMKKGQWINGRLVVE